MLITLAATFFDFKDAIFDFMNNGFVEIEFSLPGFEKHEHPTWRAWSPEVIDSKDWYHVFEERVLAAIGREFLPVVRLADGEFTFLIGEIPPNPRWTTYMRFRHRISQFYKNRILKSDFSFSTPSAYSSAVYTREEWSKFRQSYLDNLIWIAQKGILAPQLAFLGRPTIEQLQDGFMCWLSSTDLSPTRYDLVQFYFVYALLLSSDKPEVVDGKRVLVVHGAKDERKQKIVDALYKHGAVEVHWVEISMNRSLFDKVDISRYIGNCDICFVGAGVGKPFVMRQLEPLCIPILDIGYVFEIWINESRRYMRPYCCSDTYFDEERVKVHPTLRYILENQ